jgi:hypothetical protein
MRFPGEEREPHLKSVKVIGSESRLEDTTNLFVIAGSFQLFGGPADGKVVDYDLTLLECALRDPSQFAELKITQALHTDPNTDSEYGKNQAEGTPCWPEQKQTE